MSGSVQLLSCNTGHLATYVEEPDGNFASALSMRITGNSSVIGYDGNVGFGGKLTAIGFSDDYSPRLSNDQKSYYKILRKQTNMLRDPRGPIQYKDGRTNFYYIPGDFVMGAPKVA